MPIQFKYKLKNMGVISSGLLPNRTKNPEIQESAGDFSGTVGRTCGCFGYTHEPHWDGKYQIEPACFCRYCGQSERACWRFAVVWAEGRGFFKSRDRRNVKWLHCTADSRDQRYCKGDKNGVSKIYERREIENKKPLSENIPKGVLVSILLLTPKAGGSFSVAPDKRKP